MENSLYSKVYVWMFIGLFISFLSGYFLSINPSIVYSIMLTNKFWLIIILELGIAIFFGARINKMSSTTAKICFILYSLTTGFTLSIIFLAYKLSSIVMIFGVTATLFGIFAVYGLLTKKDITKWGTYLLMILFGIIIVTIVNIFFENTTLDLIISIIGVILFLLFVAYDMKTIKSLVATIPEENVAIYGAFTLYLDFINLFLRLIRIFGKNRD